METCSAMFRSPKEWDICSYHCSVTAHYGHDTWFSAPLQFVMKVKVCKGLVPLMKGYPCLAEKSQLITTLYGLILWSPSSVYIWLPVRDTLKKIFVVSHYGSVFGLQWKNSSQLVFSLYNFRYFTLCNQVCNMCNYYK